VQRTRWRQSPRVGTSSRSSTPADVKRFEHAAED
jgi:hypothetical protein